MHQQQQQSQLQLLKLLVKKLLLRAACVACDVAKIPTKQDLVENRLAVDEVLI